MPDDNPPTSPAPQPPKRPPAASNGINTTKSTGFATGINASNAPPGHVIRRAKTTDDGPSLRRKSHTSRSEASFDGMSPGLPRRSSNFSDYSLSEARDILNPRAQTSQELPSPESSSLASLSLAFALLPAIAGALFKNGHAVITDVLLLGLSGVFLHWSVTQPWYVMSTNTRPLVKGGGSAWTQLRVLTILFSCQGLVSCSATSSHTARGAYANRCGGR